MVRKIIVGTVWRLPFHPLIKVVYGHFHETWIYCPILRVKKVSPFKSGPFSKAYQFFSNWKFQLGKDVGWILHSGSRELSKKPALDTVSSWTDLCFVAPAMLSWTLLLWGLPANSPLRSFFFIFAFLYNYPTMADLGKSISVLTALVCCTQILTQSRERYHYSFTHTHLILPWDFTASNS